MPMLLCLGGMCASVPCTSKVSLPHTKNLRRLDADCLPAVASRLENMFPGLCRATGAWLGPWRHEIVQMLDRSAHAHGMTQMEEDEPDALDAFMADAVLPEVQAKAAEAAAAREEARLKKAQERAVRLGASHLRRPRSLWLTLHHCNMMITSLNFIPSRSNVTHMQCCTSHTRMISRAPSA